jgi:TatD DNase family protein
LFDTVGTQVSKYANIVGIGETGMDFYYFNDQSDETTIVTHQEELFVQHIALATQLKLPLVIHARGRDTADMSAYKECFRILTQEHFSGKVYFHSFAGDISLAKKVLDDGNVIGVNGIITYANAKLLAEVITYTPLESILLETDSPYLIPSNLDRSILTDKKINEPIGIFSVAKRVAALKKVPPEEILEQTRQNTQAVFERIL